MKVFGRFLAWFGVSLTSLILLLSITDGSSAILASLCFLAALLFIFPPLQGLIPEQFSFLKNLFLKLTIWLILMITGSVLSPYQIVHSFSLCTEIKTYGCPQEATDLVKNSQSLYLAGEQENLDDETEFTVIFTPKSNSQLGTETIRKTVKAKINKKIFWLEIDANDLPSNTYEVSLEHEYTSLPESFVKELTVWDAEVNNLDFCVKQEGDVCLQKSTALLKNQPTISVLVTTDRSSCQS